MMGNDIFATRMILAAVVHIDYEIATSYWKLRLWPFSELDECIRDVENYFHVLKFHLRRLLKVGEVHGSRLVVDVSSVDLS